MRKKKNEKEVLFSDSHQGSSGDVVRLEVSSVNSRVKLAARKISLPYSLSDSELRLHAELMASLLREERDLCITAKSVASSYKDRIGGVRDKISQVSHVVSTGIEYRDFPCTEYADYDRDCVLILRDDTGEEIERRPLTDSERQQCLPMVSFLD